MDAKADVALANIFWVSDKDMAPFEGAGGSTGIGCN